MFKTVDGSSLFQVKVFTPNQQTTKAANRLCLCDICKQDYGSGALFKSYDLQVFQLKQVSLRSDIKEANTNEKVTETAHEFLLAGTFCALATDSKSSDAIWFVKSEEEIGPATDDYSRKIQDGCKYL